MTTTTQRRADWEAEAEWHGFHADDIQSMSDDALELAVLTAARVSLIRRYAPPAPRGSIVAIDLPDARLDWLLGLIMDADITVDEAALIASAELGVTKAIARRHLELVPHPIARLMRGASC